MACKSIAVSVGEIPMILFWILLALLLLTALLVCYSALVVASRADEWEERREDEQVDRR